MRSGQPLGPCRGARAAATPGPWACDSLGILNNGLDHVDIDSFLKILIRSPILLIVLVINVCAEAQGRAQVRGRFRRPFGTRSGCAVAVPVRDEALFRFEGRIRG